MQPRVALLGSVLVLACATGGSAVRPLPVFYPPLPNPPRIQYLTTFSTAADVGEPRSGFAEFIAGKDPKKTLVVQKPYGAGIHGGRLYVVDLRGGGYAVFDVARREFGFVTGVGPGQMKRPSSLAIDADGTKYVADVGRDQVLAFDAQDRFVRAYGVTGQFKPGGIAVWKDRLYVSDLAHHEVHVLDKRSGTSLFTIGKQGSRDGEFGYPTNLAMSADGHLYVSDMMNFRVQELTADGRFVRSFGTLGDRPGQLSRPKGVAVDRDGRVYVVDAAFENVQLFDAEGRILMYFGGPGAGRENVNLPAAVAVDYGNVALFQRYAAPGFKLEYLVLVASQFGQSKLNVFGFGRMEGVDYDAKPPAAAGK